MAKWWKQDDMNLASSVWETAETLDSLDITRTNKALNYARMYSNQDLMGLEPSSIRSIEDIGFWSSENSRMRWNVLASIVDTLHSRIAQHKPRIVFLPNEANTKIHRKAKNMEKFVAGAFEATKFYEKAPMAFLLAEMGGTGIAYVYAENGNPAVEIVRPQEIKVDPQEAMYGEPRQILRRKHVDRDVLVEMFPDSEIEIRAADNMLDQDLGNAESTSDLATVIEAWHLPSGPNANDGKHCIVVNNKTLFVEDYEEDDFPFVFLRWKNNPYDFWGTGLVQDLMPAQLEINNILMRIQEAQELLSSPIVFVNVASEISTNHIGPGINFVPHTGQKPEVATFATQHPEIYRHLIYLEAGMYKMAGISEMSAQGKNILGPNASGEAIRQLSDMEAAKFALNSQSYNKFFIDVAKKMIKVTRALHESGEDVGFNVKGKDFINEIKWKDVDMDADQYDLALGSASMLPMTQAGRTQTALEYMQAGLWTPEQAADELDIPDIDSQRALNRAPREYIRDITDRMLENGEAFVPEKFDDLAYAVKYMIFRYNKAKLAGISEERRQLLIDFIEEADRLLKPPEPLVPPPMPAPAPTKKPKASPPTSVQAVPPGPPNVPQGA